YASTASISVVELKQIDGSRIGLPRFFLLNRLDESQRPRRQARPQAVLRSDMHIKGPWTAPSWTFQRAHGNVALPAAYQIPKRAIRCEDLGRSQLQRQIHEKVPLEGIRFDDMGSSAIQSKIVFSNPVQIIAKQPVRAFEGQREDVPN